LHIDSFLMNVKIALLVFVSLMLMEKHPLAQDTKKENPVSEGTVTYAYKSNGKEIKDRRLQLVFKNNVACLMNIPDQQENEGRFIDYNLNETLQMLTLKNGEKYTLKTPFTKIEKATLTGETDTILGYKCKKAKLVIRSNAIDVWFTNDLSLKGSPSLGIAPGLGLVLKIIRNGNFEIYATNVEFKKVEDSSFLFRAAEGNVVDEAIYRRKIIDNRYISIPVFSHQQINFTDSIINPEEDLENLVYRYAGGTIVLKKIKLLDKGNYSVFAKLTQYSNGDAYDRTGTVFIIPVNREISFLDGLRKGIKALPVYKDKDQKEYQGVVATEKYLPPLELMRFFTPFGVRAYNKNVEIDGYHWADSVDYKQDITDLLPSLRGDVWIGVFIGNYDKGGHIINLELDYYPSEKSDDQKHWVTPIFNTLNIMEMAGQAYGTMFNRDSLTVSVDVPSGLKNLTLRYIATGHGGWDGGDEFNQKVNDIILDGKSIYHFIPWRTDCATYRMANPSSGNFEDGLSSSDLSRSNWCPGTTTNPVYIPISNLKPGRHTFKIAIPLGAPEGNSFSAWNVSGTLIGEFQ